MQSTVEAYHSSIHIHVVHTHETSNKHPVQAFNMFMTIYEENTIAVKYKDTYLEKKLPRN